MSILTIQQLKRHVKWDNVLLERGSHSFAGKDHPYCIMRILPSDAAWPSIDLHFDENITILDPLGFGGWHAHYDRWEDNRRNLVDALKAIRPLVTGERCLVEELNEEGKYRGSSVLKPSAIPGTLSKDIRRLRRVFFNRPPVLEEIDFSRYWEGKHLFVEWSTKEETEKFWTELGMPITW